MAAKLNYEVLAGTGYDGYILKDAPVKFLLTRTTLTRLSLLSRQQARTLTFSASLSSQRKALSSADKARDTSNIIAITAKISEFTIKTTSTTGYGIWKIFKVW